MVTETTTKTELETGPTPRRTGALLPTVAAVVLLALVVGVGTLLADGDDEPAPVVSGDLIAETEAALARYADIDAAKADGYIPIAATSDESTEAYLHLVDPGRVADDTVADPNEVESLLYSRGDDGQMHLLAAMYVLPPDQTIDDAPRVPDERAHWHAHTDLCWQEDAPGIIAGPAIDGECVSGGSYAPLAMLHVWIVENECGPFADLVGHGSETSVCNHEHLPIAFRDRVSG
jgi:hypothetical protein